MNSLEKITLSNRICSREYGNTLRVPTTTTARPRLVPHRPARRAGAVALPSAGPSRQAEEQGAASDASAAIGSRKDATPLRHHGSAQSLRNRRGDGRQAGRKRSRPGHTHRRGRFARASSTAAASDRAAAVAGALVGQAGSTEVSRVSAAPSSATATSTSATAIAIAVAAVAIATTAATSTASAATRTLLRHASAPEPPGIPRRHRRRHQPCDGGDTVPVRAAAAARRGRQPRERQRAEQPMHRRQSHDLLRATARAARRLDVAIGAHTPRLARAERLDVGVLAAGRQRAARASRRLRWPSVR